MKGEISGFLMSPPPPVFDILLFVVQFLQGSGCAAFAPTVAQNADGVTFLFFFLEPSRVPPDSVLYWKNLDRFASR
jgi:hypothetical protein